MFPSGIFRKAGQYTPSNIPNRKCHTVALNLITKNPASRLRARRSAMLGNVVRHLEKGPREGGGFTSKSSVSDCRREARFEQVMIVVIPRRAYNREKLPRPRLEE